MKRHIEFSEGIVSGETMEEVVKILEPIVNIGEYFKQRKTYFEYYFDSRELGEVNFDIETIEKLSNEYRVDINYDTLIIKI